jgi:hypothetical protein
LTTKEDWTAVLKLSNLFDFASLRKFAITKLFPITNAIDKIVLARDYGTDEWLEDAYLDVCMAGSLPSDDDSEALGLPTFRKIARVREILNIRESSEYVFPRIPSYRDRTIVLGAFFTNNHPDISTSHTSDTSSEAYLTPTPASPVDNATAILDPSESPFPTPSTSSCVADVQEAELVSRETTVQALEKARRLQETAELNMREHQRLAAEAESERVREVKQKLQMVEECRAMELHLREMESQLSAAMQALEETRRLQEVAELKALDHQRLAVEAESARLAEHEQSLRMAEERRAMELHLREMESQLDTAVQALGEARCLRETAEQSILVQQRLVAEAESGRLQAHEQKLRMAEEYREMEVRLEDSRHSLKTIQDELAETRRLADLDRQRHLGQRQTLEAGLHEALKRLAEATEADYRMRRRFGLPGQALRTQSQLAEEQPRQENEEAEVNDPINDLTHGHPTSAEAATEVQSEQTPERSDTSQGDYDRASMPSTSTSRHLFSWALWLYPFSANAEAQPEHVPEERPGISQVNIDRPFVTATAVPDHRSAWDEWWYNRP